MRQRPRTACSLAVIALFLLFLLLAVVVQSASTPNDGFTLPLHYIEFLQKFRFIIYGATKYERFIDLEGSYTKLFYAEAFEDNDSMCLIGVEDLDEGRKPDGWTDILLPIFYSNKAPNACNTTDKYLFYVDTAMGGSYKKELWFKTGNAWAKLYSYIPEKGGLVTGNSEVLVSVGYIEYYPEEDRICTPHGAVDIIPPNVTNVSQIPLENNIQPRDEVKVTAIVTDNLSGVKRVALNYTYTNSSATWFNVVDMTNLEGDIWNATIPTFRYSMNVTYAIVAEDYVGNIIATEGYEYQYHIVPEFPSLIILPLFMITTLLAVAVRKRKCSISAALALISLFCHF
jgi:hypothetical protein